jgi:hypothetical protein
MKKNTYMTPAMQVVEAETQEMLAASGVSSEGIEYGGVDIDGSLDAAAAEMLLLEE